MFLFLQYISNILDLNACAWSQRRLRGMPWNSQYFCKKFMSVVASQLGCTTADGKREKRSTATKIYVSLLDSFGMGPAKSSCTSWFGSSSLGSLPKSDFGISGLRFLPWSVHCLQFSARSLIVR